MATQTSIANGLWSSSATWDGTVPADGDTVIIAAGHTVIFDVDQSAWVTGINGLTITGTLSVQSATGTYYMFMKAAATIAGAGTFNVGTSGTPIPFQTKFTLTGGAAWFIEGSGGLTMTAYGAEPTITTILLSGDEAIGQTELSVGTDVTGDIWAAGDTIRIDDINKTNESEERVIAAGGIASGAITVTAGLTAAKSTGAVVSLITRNIKFLGVGAAGFVAKNFASGKLTIAGGQWATANYRTFSACTATISGGAFTSSDNVFRGGTYTISGGVFSGNSYVLYQCTAATISGGSFTGASTIIYLTHGVTVSGGTFKGNSAVFSNSYRSTISGGTYLGNAIVAQTCIGINIFGGSFTAGTTAINQCSGFIKNATFSGNSTADIAESVFTAFNSAFGSTTEVGTYTSASKESYSESIDHDQQAGAYKAWTKGGVTTKQATVYPTGYTYSYQTVLENASVEGFWQREVTVGAGASVNVTMWLRKTASMTYLPRIQVFLKSGTDPFAGGTPLKTFTMTDSIDTFEDDLYTYTNSTSEDITLVCRALGMNASGSVYSVIDIEQINVDLTTALAALVAIQAKTDNLPSDPADQSAVEAAITASEGTITTAISGLPTLTQIFGYAVEGTETFVQWIRLVAAALFGKTTGSPTTAVKFRNLADTKDRISGTVDTDGNRTAVTLDGD